MIEVKNLVKKYGNHTAVKNLSFTVEKGQVYGFLGPNGAGKSTTMNIIIGYLSATSGEVLINGHSIFDEPEEAKRYIGYLPEIPPLYLDMTVKEYLVFAAELKKIPKKDRAKNVKEAMEMTMITQMENWLIKHLSKGYKQRVGLAQAILGYPEIIILDEPTVGLDPKQIIEIRDLIKKLSEKHTIILSSHIMQEISAVCDHILIINKGELVAEGTPEQLTELAQPTQEVKMRVKGNKSAIETVLKGMKKVHRQEFSISEEKGTVDVLVYAAKEADIREELFHTFSKEELPILFMSAQVKSLEDIFLEVTDDSKKYVPYKKSGKKNTKEEVVKEVLDGNETEEVNKNIKTTESEDGDESDI
ncbi:MAG: ABC transporter ATP-binding protein [Lachnospiraceae bacterium]|nr:ABC transporter ATP-binding protein [Lachnospiraceae bacterium]